jgi:wyosine [tRNA(Phe)-imidazoG37] synthetase (radical SAM superfamily)
MIVFGPIPSRRLGASLGINNIVLHKVCSYGCVYCQIGNTTKKTIKRERFYEPQKLLKEVETHIKKLDKDHAPDYLTFVASGEPTLDTNLGTEIKMLRKLGIPIAVITNSSLIYDRSVQDDLLHADWISFKVDTVSEPVWKRINRPLARIDFAMVLQSLIEFSAAYNGKLNTETMLLDGYNDSDKQLRDNASYIAMLNPQKAYLSIPTRPPAVKEVKAVSEERIAEAWHIYQQAGIHTELLTGFEGTGAGTTGSAYDDILNITSVHPLREDVLAAILKQNKAGKSVIDSLISNGLIKVSKYQGNTFYVRRYHIQ